MVKSKTMTTESTITTTEQITYDSDMMSAELDKIQLNKSQTIKGILRLVICSAIGIAAFFVSVPHNGKNSTDQQEKGCILFWTCADRGRT